MGQASNQACLLFVNMSTKSLPSLVAKPFSILRLQRQGVNPHSTLHSLNKFQTLLGKMSRLFKGMTASTLREMGRSVPPSPSDFNPQLSPGDISGVSYLQSLQESEGPKPATAGNQTESGIVQHFPIIIPVERAGAVSRARLAGRFRTSGHTPVWTFTFPCTRPWRKVLLCKREQT